MKEILLTNLELKTFTAQNASDYCQINNINYNKIIGLDLFNNELTDISGIKLFKNVEILDLNKNQLTDISVLKNLKKLKILLINNNKIKDISVIQYLNNLETLYIDNLELESDQFKYINSCKNLEELYCLKGFKDVSTIKQINKNIQIK